MYCVNFILLMTSFLILIESLWNQRSTRKTDKNSSQFYLNKIQLYFTNGFSLKCKYSRNPISISKIKLSSWKTESSIGVCFLATILAKSYISYLSPLIFGMLKRCESHGVKLFHILVRWNYCRTVNHSLCLYQYKFINIKSLKMVLQN